MFKHRDNQDYLNINQIPYFLHVFNRMETSIKWEHRSFYGVLLFNKFMNHSLHNNLTNLDFSCLFRWVASHTDNCTNGKALKAFFAYAGQHPLKCRKRKTLSLEGNELGDLDIAQFCKAVRSGAYKRMDTLCLKSECERRE